MALLNLPSDDQLIDLLALILAYAVWRKLLAQAGRLTSSQRVVLRRLLGTSERCLREKVIYSRHLRSSAYRDTIPSEEDFLVLLSLYVVTYLDLDIEGGGWLTYHDVI